MKGYPLICRGIRGLVLAAACLAVACGGSGNASVGGRGPPSDAGPEPCQGPGDCPDPTLPNCDPATGACVGPCPDTPCSEEFPNCSADGACTGPCSRSGDCPSASPNCNPSTGRCTDPCTADGDCPDPAAPNCNAQTGLCFGECSENADCPDPDRPNCDARDGSCFGRCSTSTDCVDPSAPSCDEATGLCQGPCPSADCPPGLPNCGSGGRCLPPCESNADCSPILPNCDDTTGLCQGPCPANPCPDAIPNCDDSGVCSGPCSTNQDCTNPAEPNCNDGSGLCVGPCSDNGDCPSSAAPNCGGDGVCFGPCTAHADCTASGRPNCQLDSTLPDAGLCGARCSANADCPSPQFPNCDAVDGTCLPLCSSDADCPPSASKCDTATGLCFQPGCTVDADCSPPTTVCEDFFCVAGCEAHDDCLPGDRCNLVGPGNLNHCEPRDCLSDADCTAPAVCDTDGLVDPDGGGFCVGGCTTHYDCGTSGYDCDSATGTCQAKDYGDIGADCGSGCDSGVCLSTQGNVCTDFCCTQHDCPAGWGCRTSPDGSGVAGRTIDVCLPLSAPGAGRYDDPCTEDAECRSNLCTGGVCQETCCTDQDCDQPFAQNMYCVLAGAGNPSACAPEPLQNNDPMGTLGCSTSGAPSDCRSNMCFSFYIPDTSCTTNADCPAERPVCWDWPNNSPNGINDCVRDMCVDHCCSVDDCPSSGSDDYYCDEVVFSAGDFDVCLYHFGGGTLAEGEPCTTNGQCRSNFCSAVDGLCRRRCCTDGDCSDPRFPNCALETFDTVLAQRLANVCTPP